MFGQSWSKAMYPSTRLKLSAVLFTVFWIGGMLWWSGSMDGVNIIMLTICGVLVGYFWYRAMRWHLPRGRMPARRLARG
jgi:hypothetical protein